MIPWIILSVIIILAFFFFLSGREKNQRKIYIKHRPQKKRQHTDTEFASESPLPKLKRSDQESDLSTIAPPVIRWEGSESTPDHSVHIGGQPTSISGHQMSIEMKIEPLFLALAKDPYWIFLAWSLPKEYPEGALEIKIKNLSANTESFLSINTQLNNWYLHLNQPDKRFSFELGIRDLLGEFQTLLYSNEVKTPPNRPSDIIASDWVVIDQFYQKKLVVSPEGSPEYLIAKKIGGSEQLIK